MHKQLAVSIFAAALLAFSGSSAIAKPKSGHGVSGSPPHASTTGMGSRSSEARRHGANKKPFCPPGQAKKRGDGSAFRC